MATSAGNIFISYRREDSAPYAGRIFDQLTPLFGGSRVFMDVDIRPGENFAQAIDQRIAACSALLVIIGPRWMEILQKRSEQDHSQEKPQDYVHHEIEAALARKILIIPVLVGGASMNQLTDLPPNLGELLLHEAIELRDSTFKEDFTRLANALGSAEGLKPQDAEKRTGGNRFWPWIGSFAALVAALIALSIWAGPWPWSEAHQRKVRIEQILTTARVQTDQGEYESAFRSCQEALKLDPGNPAMLDRQLSAAMLWAENFHALGRAGQQPEDLAIPLLREIASTLEAGLARTNGQGSKAADILAHLGWTHWLNRHIAHQEFNSTAEDLMRKALKLDPSNVYGNAMLGNWILQNSGSLDEALRHFDLAVKGGKQRPLVRVMQLGGMLNNNTPGVRTELIRVANQMRINAEPMDPGDKHQILSAFNSINSPKDLKETLTAVPPDQAWATFRWLDDYQQSDRKEQQRQHDFVHANILEISGKREEALASFQALQQDLKSRGYTTRMDTHVSDAIKRLSLP